MKTERYFLIFIEKDENSNLTATLPELNYTSTCSDKGMDHLMEMVKEVGELYLEDCNESSIKILTLNEILSLDPDLYVDDNTIISVIKLSYEYNTRG